MTTYDTMIVDPRDDKAMEAAAAALRRGETVAFPTETVYGLGGNAADPEAIKKIFEAKGRPSDNPLIVHIWNKDQIPELAAEITPLASVLIDRFMPGPITVIVKKNSEKVCDETTAGLDTVGIRMPSDKICRRFLMMCDIPVAAPSANLSGSPSPTTALHVINDLDKRVFAIINGGSCEVGLESTVVDATGEKPVILRPGAITADMIEEAVGMETSSKTKAAEGETPRAPGMKYRHYAPRVPVEKIAIPESVLNAEVVEIPESEDGKDPYKKLTDDQKQILFDAALPFIQRSREILEANPMARIGIFAGREVRAVFEKMGDRILLAHTEFNIYGDSKDIEAASHSLFDGLRHLDIQEVNTILAASFPEGGLATAYMNRLGKAAGGTGDTPSGAALQSVRHEVPLDAFRDVFTASVLFVSDEDRALGAACEGIMRKYLNERGPYCSEHSTEVGAEIYCESAGLYAVDGDIPDKRMEEVFAETVGTSISHHLATKAGPSVYDMNDLIITMHDDQAYEIASAFPYIADRVFSISSYAASKGIVIKDERSRVVSVSIPDPKGENRETYVHTVKALAAWLDILFPYIIKDLGASRL